MLYEDLVNNHLGVFGKYQLVVFLCNSLVSLPFAINNLAIVFQTGVPDHWCDVPALTALDINDTLYKDVAIPVLEYREDGSPKYAECSVYDTNYTGWTTDDIISSKGNYPNKTLKCNNGWVYSRDVYTETVVSEFNQVCGRDVMIATSMSVSQAGIMLGSFLSGILSDVVGRKRTLTIAVCFQMLSFVATSLSPSMLVFVSLRFFTGFFSSAVYTSGYVNVMELVGGTARVHVSLVNGMVWSFFYIVVSAIGYFLTDWRHIQYAGAASITLIFCTIPILSESPRWLYSQGKNKAADKVVRKVAKWNKKSLPEPLSIYVKDAQTVYFWEMFKTPRLRKRMLANCFCWFVNALVYYGLAFNTSNLGGNPYFNFFIAGAVEMLGYIFIEICNLYLGRVKIMSFTMIFAGVSLLATIPVTKESLTWLRITLSMTGKMCIGASYGLLWLLTAEMFPTVTRQAAISSSYFVASIGGILAPYINILSKCLSWGCHAFVPSLIFGVLACCAGLLGFYFPETKGRKLPETLIEGENFGVLLPESESKEAQENGITNISFSTFSEKETSPELLSDRI